MISNVVHIESYSDPLNLWRQSPLFSQLTNDQLHSVKSFCKIVQLQDGQTLFHQGNISLNLYLVSKGQVKLFRQTKAGQEKIFDIATRGAVIGETSIFQSEHQYLYSSAAVSESTVLVINRQNYIDIIKDSPDALMSSLNYFSQRVQELIDEIERLSLLTGSNRIASYLYDQYLHCGESFSLGINKKDIASILGLTPETFSRLLKGLRTKNVICFKDLHITIQDKDLLKELACK